MVEYVFPKKAGKPPLYLRKQILTQPKAPHFFPLLTIYFSCQSISDSNQNQLQLIAF